MNVPSRTMPTDDSSIPTSPDLEKGQDNFPITLPLPTTPPAYSNSVTSTFARWNAKIESLSGFEARGITRVLPSERHAASIMGDFQMAFMWFSANISANNLAVGLLGPLVFQLGFVDSALCSTFGILLGSLMTAYMSIWGAQSGNRTMVCLPR